MEEQTVEVSVVMPCLNEEQTLSTCIQKASDCMEISGISGEVVIADNGSTDRSVKIAKDAGARVITVKEKGYGAALRSGIAVARGKYVVMGDADDSYDFSNLMPFIEKLREGYELVMGNRFSGGIEQGAMPFLHKYLGNPVLSFIGRLFFRSDIRDFHCGLRGFRKEAIEGLGLVTSGMEFASEMVVKASLQKLSIAEVPTILSTDGRDREPHLRSWRDGWRHLRFLLLLSPRWLFLYPCYFMLLFGLGVSVAVYSGQTILGAGLGVHSLLYAMAFIVVGATLGGLAISSRLVGEKIGLFPENRKVERLLSFFSLEKAIIIGIFLVVVGFAFSVYFSSDWFWSGFPALEPEQFMLRVIPCVMVGIIGMNIILFSFLCNIINLIMEKTIDRSAKP